MITIFEEKICLDYDCVKLLFNEHEVDELIDFLENTELSRCVLGATCNIWYNKEGKKHRLNGPAMVFANGDKIWYLDGKVYRINGPAVEYSSGHREWWVNGQQIAQEDDFLNTNFDF